VTGVRIESKSDLQNGKTNKLISRYRGKILLLLLGMDGCPGTKKASDFLAKYSASRPKGVAILRVDVPTPGGKLKKVGKWNRPFLRKIDLDRNVAKQMDFFYYPTFYILDKDGDIRFFGKCDPKQVTTIVSELLSEKPGSPKRIYTPLLPEIGGIAEGFKGKLLDGNAVTLKELRGKVATLLFFGSISCPFSAKSEVFLPALAKEFKKYDIKFVIISMDQSKNSIKSFYSKGKPEIPIVIDTNRKIGKEKYMVPAVPFFYIIDKQGKIVSRKPYTADAARKEIKLLLGLKIDSGKAMKTGAG
jgi:peroxiredoxin